MSQAYALKGVSPAAGSNLPQIVAFATARTAANDTLFEVWNGSTNAARKFVVDLDGKWYSAAATAGDVPYAVAGSVSNVKRFDFLAIGAAGKLVRSTGTAPAYTTATFPDTAAAGDILYASALNTWAALTVGSAGKIIRAGASLPAYSTFTIVNTFAQGALPHASTADTLTALAVGGANAVLTSSGTLPQWTAGLTDAHISASAEIAVSKLADGSARQLLQTDAAGTGVEWASNIDIPGTLDVTGAVVFDSTLNVVGNVTGPHGIFSTLRRATADGSDNDSLSLGAGGNATSDRGATIDMFGNEHANTGRMDLIAGNVAGGVIRFLTAATERLRIDKTDGNIGFKTTDIEAWDTSWAAMHLGAVHALAATTTRCALLYNTYADPADFKYRTTAVAAKYEILSGAHVFSVAASGTIDTAITFSEVLRMDYSAAARLGFFGVTPVARAAAYTATNVTTDRSYDADTVAVAELADVVGTLIADLRTYGLLQ